jgi:hypothetical protein
MDLFIATISRMKADHVTGPWRLTGKGMTGKSTIMMQGVEGLVIGQVRFSLPAVSAVDVCDRQRDSFK